MSKELLDACESNDIYRAEKLLKIPFDIHYKNEYDQTCLHWACINKNIELVKLLLDAGAKDIINSIDKDKFTCLYLACWGNNIELVKLLLDAGAKDSVNVIDYANRTCLFWAYFHSNINLAKLLLGNGAIIDDETIHKHLNFLLKARL